MRISLRNKIYGLALVAATLPVVVLLLLMLQFRSRVSQEAAREMTSLAEANVEQAAKDAYGLCETANDLLQRRVNQNLAVARRILAQKGGLGTSEGTAQWQAVNQFTQGTVDITLPQVLIGGAPAAQNRSFQVASPFVDEVSKLVGSAVTVFQRMNESGDMLRVATTVATTDGNRGIGTYFPAVGPDGTPSPAVAAVLRGEVYRGAAFAVNDLYVAAYEPLRDRAARVIGMLFVGERISAVERWNARRRKHLGNAGLRRQPVCAADGPARPRVGEGGDFPPIVRLAEPGGAEAEIETRRPDIFRAVGLVNQCERLRR